MEPTRVERKLTAILSADVKGYSRLMGEDEVATIRTLTKYRELMASLILKHWGRVVDSPGDNLLAEFVSVVDAVQCALVIQRTLRAENTSLAPNRQMAYRIGINVGDVVVEGERIYGDGVNIAARLESLAEGGGICISGTVYDQVKTKLALGFEYQGEQAVKNISEPVRMYKVELEAEGASSSVSHEPPEILPLPDNPSIAVLPFTNMSSDPEQEYFADGLVEDIITTLSKLSGLKVIARNSSFLYKNKAVDVRAVARELGVRYVLEGSVRKGGDRMRITAQLIDAPSGSHVWAERYDRTIDDIFTIQDEITLILATEMQINLTEGEQARLRYSTTTNVEAWTHWTHGLDHYRTGVPTKDGIGLARPYWEKALALDPNSASLNAMLGFLSYADARFGWWDDRESALKKGHDYVEKAFRLEPNNADAHMVSGLLLMLQMRHAEAVAHARKSVELAPGSADAAVFACFVLASSGFSEEAVTQIEKAITLSPRYPAYYLGHLGNAYRVAERIDEAIAAFKEYGRRSPGFGLSDLVIAYQQKGNAEQARQVAIELMNAKPNFTVSGWASTQFRNDAEKLKAEMSALRSAGLP